MREDDVLYWYTTQSSMGAVSLLPTGNGRYKVVIDKTESQVFSNLEEAFIAVHGGSKLDGFDNTTLQALELPGHIDNWEQKPFATVKRLRPGNT